MVFVFSFKYNIYNDYYWYNMVNMENKYEYNVVFVNNHLFDNDFTIHLFYITRSTKIYRLNVNINMQVKPKFFNPHKYPYVSFKYISV